MTGTYDIDAFGWAFAAEIVSINDHTLSNDEFHACARMIKEGRPCSL